MEEGAGAAGTRCSSRHPESCGMVRTAVGGGSLRTLLLDQPEGELVRVATGGAYVRVLDWDDLGTGAPDDNLMGCLLFLLLKYFRVVETNFDLPWLCLLMALEGPGYLRVFLYWKSLRR